METTSGLLFDHPLHERYDVALAALGVTARTLWMNPIHE